MFFRFYIAFIACFIGAASSAHAANTPEVQAVLEQAEATFKNHNDGVIMVSETLITDRALEVRFKGVPNVAPAAAAERMKEKAGSWAKAMCASSTVAPFLRRTGTTLSLTFETAPGTYEVQARVEPTTCPDQPQVRTIDGQLLYPRPSRDEAVAQILEKLKYSLLDFNSAQIECSDVSQAISYKPLLERRRYGYVVKCAVNAKNAYGGYAGYEDRWYFFNGPVFQYLIESNPSFKLIDQ
jgi:hypothetical protein